MPKKLEVREGDRIQVWLEITRVADELDIVGRQIVTAQVVDQKVTAPLDNFHANKVERGNNWPDEPT